MDNHQEILKNLPLWQGREITIDKLVGGQTNFNYLVIDQDKKHVARFAPQTAALLGLDRKREISNTKIVGELDLGPKIVAFLPEYNLLIVEYIDGEILPSERLREPERIKAMAGLLAKIHQGPKFMGEFKPLALICSHIAQAREYKVWFPANFGSLFDKFKQAEAKIKHFACDWPCHVDLVIENIIWTKSGTKLLDWEYSANSDFRYDLAMLSAMAEFNEEQDKILLKEYGDQSPDLFDQIQLIKLAVCFREAAWAFLQQAISKKDDVDYKKYALDNLDKFREYAKNLN